MKVKIVKASKPTYWYADKIGQVFEVDDIPTRGSTAYWVTQHGYDSCLISKADCEVVNDRD